MTKAKLKKNLAEHRRWAASPEGIWETMGFVAGAETDDQQAIVQTIAALPKKARELAVGLIFVSMTDVDGFVHRTYCPGHDQPQEQTWIFLNMGSLSFSKKKDTVAHEIAHAYLGHDDVGKVTSNKNEREADDLAEEWGFKRSYSKKALKRFEG
jgi:hypothetical protein